MRFLAVLLSLATWAAATPNPAGDPVAAAQALVKRVVPSIAGQVVCEAIPADNGHDVFEIETVDHKLVLRGNSGVSIASALNHYLKNYAKCHLSWCGDQLSLPALLPSVPVRERVVNLHRYRVMFNYCTYNYTCSWWDWPRWERELDFLAMNGINAPLGVIGLEGVWYETLRKHGFNDEEARTFLVGPAFFAWEWMTNIQSNGGPVPKSWIDARVKLGQQWMNRARELGMTPIRQGYSGNVPRLLREKQPQAAIAFQPSWCGFPGSAQLDPTDPLFKPLGTTFMQVSIRLYG
jgi:alpha-N-acetylglucosaminidase